MDLTQGLLYTIPQTGGKTAVKKTPNLSSGDFYLFSGVNKSQFPL